MMTCKKAKNDITKSRMPTAIASLRASEESSLMRKFMFSSLKSTEHWIWLSLHLLCGHLSATDVISG